MEHFDALATLGGEELYDVFSDKLFSKRWKTCDELPVMKITEQ